MGSTHILVLAGEDAQSALVEAGFRIAGADDAPGQTACIVLEARGAAGEKAGQLARSLRAALGPRAGLMFAWADDDSRHDPAAFDGALPADASPALLRARLAPALRIAVMADEARLRFQTLARFGGAAQPPAAMETTGVRVLIVGQPGPAMMSIGAALEALNAHTIACLTSFTAFDYLHHGGFDAVVLVAEDDGAGAKAFCAALRRNARLFHLPCLVVASPGLEGRSDLAAKGATAVALAGADDPAAALALIGSVDEARRRDALALAFAAARTARAMDPGTGLYSREFLLAHLDVLVRQSEITDRALSFAIVRFAPGSFAALAAGARDEIVGQAGAMLGRLVRAEDLAARFGPEAFALAFPASDLDAASRAAERIAAVLECTGFSSGDADQTITLRFEVAAVEWLRGRDARDMVLTAERGLTQASACERVADF